MPVSIGRGGWIGSSAVQALPDYFSICLCYFALPVGGQEQVRIQERFFVLLGRVHFLMGQRC